MNYYTVKQIAIPENEKNLPNECGSWDECVKKSFHWKTKLDLQRVDFVEGDFEMSQQQKDIYTDRYLVQAEDLGTYSELLIFGISQITYTHIVQVIVQVLETL